MINVVYDLIKRPYSNLPYLFEEPIDLEKYSDPDESYALIASKLDNYPAETLTLYLNPEKTSYGEAELWTVLIWAMRQNVIVYLYIFDQKDKWFSNEAIRYDKAKIENLYHAIFD